VALVEAFRRTAERLGLPCRMIGSDRDALAPALHVCDIRAVTRPVNDPGYVAQLRAICRKHAVRLIVPTIDPELRVLAEVREQFAERGVHVLVSSPKVVAICQDKARTYRFLIDHGFRTPRTWRAAELGRRLPKFPVFLKPASGSASKGTALAENPEDYAYWRKRIPDCLVQEYVRGPEYTCDVYVDSRRAVRCVVPRRRIEVRGGEVTRSRVEKRPAVMAECRRLVETLGAGPGVITIQGFLDERGEMVFTEVNPRFGGGVPLSIQAGADFPRWVLEELEGRRPRIRFSGFTDGLLMLRYDKEIWVRGGGAG